MQVPFPGRTSYKAKKTRLCLFLQYSFFILSLFVRDTFVLRLIHTCIRSVFWLFWLSCQYFSSDWLERLLWGSLTMVRELSPQCPGWRVFMIFLSHIIVSLLYDVCILSPALRDIFHTPFHISYSYCGMVQPSCAEGTVKHQSTNYCNYLLWVVWSSCPNTSIVIWCGLIVFAYFLLHPLITDGLFEVAVRRDVATINFRCI